MKHMNTSDMALQKKILRTRALRARDELPSGQRDEQSRRIQERLFSIPGIQDFNGWFVYVSFRSEVETAELIKKLLAGGKTVSVPYIDQASHTMTASVIADPLQDLSPGIWGIPEPLPHRLAPADSSMIDVVIVPGAAFAPDGYRIGYGGGYYDRFLAGCPALTVGLAFDAQIFPEVARDILLDQPLDYIVTESRLLRCGQRR